MLPSVSLNSSFPFVLLQIKSASASVEVERLRNCDIPPVQYLFVQAPLIQLVVCLKSNIPLFRCPIFLLLFLFFCKIYFVQYLSVCLPGSLCFVSVLFLSACLPISTAVQQVSTSVTVYTVCISSAFRAMLHCVARMGHFHSKQKPLFLLTPPFSKQKLTRPVSRYTKSNIPSMTDSVVHRSTT